jgi:ABC-type multidrug transport system ATPase subunit
MSAYDLLHYFASLKGITNKSERNAIVAKALEVTNLSEVQHKHVAGYSGGMKQRFGIAQLLLNDPQLIIVDEPTAGLDPAERHRFLNVLREIGTNHIVIFSTHIVDDVKELCTDMAILNGGKILAQATPKQMVAALAGKIWTTTVDRDAIEQMQKDFNVISSNYNEDNKLNVRVFGEVSPGDAFAIAQPSLEDVYFTTLSNDKFIAETEIA